MTKNQKISIAHGTIINYKIEFVKFQDICYLLDGLLEPKIIADFINTICRNDSIENQNKWYNDGSAIEISDWILSVQD